VWQMRRQSDGAGTGSYRARIALSRSRPSNWRRCTIGQSHPRLIQEGGSPEGQSRERMGEVFSCFVKLAGRCQCSCCWSLILMSDTSTVHFGHSTDDNDKQTVNHCDGCGCAQKTRRISRSFASLWQCHGMELCQTHQIGSSSFSSDQFHEENDPPESAVVKVPFRHILALESPICGDC
jgi:hypothetical protein